MKTTIVTHYCDLCGKETDADDLKSIGVPAFIRHETEYGAPHFTLDADHIDTVTLELCPDCLERITCVKHTHPFYRDSTLQDNIYVSPLFRESKNDDADDPKTVALPQYEFDEMVKSVHDGIDSLLQGEVISRLRAYGLDIPDDKPVLNPILDQGNGSVLSDVMQRLLYLIEIEYNIRFSELR